MTVHRKVVGGVLAAVAASGLVFATSAQAAAHEVPQHWHCLYIQTLDGSVLIAQGVSEEALDKALDQFHNRVHLGQANVPLTIRADSDGECPNELPLVSAE